MSITKILYKTAILLACSIIQVFGVLIEGVSKLFGKLGEYLAILHDNLIERVETKKKPQVKKASIDIPL